MQKVHRVLADEPRIAYGLVFGSRARGTDHAGSDLDIAVGSSERLDPLAIGDLIGRLEEATGLTVDLVQLDLAPPALAYRVFRDGIVVLGRDRPALVRRKARAVLEYLDFKPFEEILVQGALERRGATVDRALLAKAVADVRAAVKRIREVLPTRVEEFLRDHTARELVVLNLFVALQQVLPLAMHRMADEGRQTHGEYRAAFRALAEHSVLDPLLAERHAKAIGLRNLIAHRYGALDWALIHDIASSNLGDLLAFCESIAGEP